MLADIKKTKQSKDELLELASFMYERFEARKNLHEAQAQTIIRTSNEDGS